MSFWLQWGVEPILSSSLRTNVSVPDLIDPLFFPFSLPFPPFLLSFLLPLFHYHPSLLVPFLSLHQNSFILIYYTLFLLPPPSHHQDHDKTQEEVLKHQASISQLKRSFMEAPPPSPPQLNQWEKRLTSSPATIRIQQQQVVCPPGCLCVTSLWKETWLCRIFVRKMRWKLH